MDYYITLLPVCAFAFVFRLSLYLNLCIFIHFSFRSLEGLCDRLAVWLSLYPTSDFCKKAYNIVFWSVCGPYFSFLVVSLEWGPLSLVSTTVELLDRKVAAPA
jgi:hypothetical protein